MPEVSVSQGHLQQKPSRKYLNYRRLGIDKIFLSFGRNEDRGLQGRRLGLYLQRFFEICRVPDFSVPYTDFGASPYAYCAGDPINLVDPDGRRIVGGTEEWNEQKTIIETRRNEVQNRVYKLIDKGKTSGERYSFLMRRLESLNKTISVH